MAIQDRRGAYTDFKPEKLKSGEWATVLSGDPNAADGRATYKCYEPGVVKRMATFEDMEENVELSLDHIFDRFTADMQTAFANANTALATMQTATTEANSAASAANDIAALVQQKLNAGDFNGKPASVSVGNVTTGAPGSKAQITARGTSTDVILDFTIPQGAKGAKGETGTVENLSDQKVTFTVADSDVDIETAETLATIFGKLLKSVQTLRTGLAGKAAASHNHSTTNITSGTLPVARGGTGQANTAAVKSAFGITALENSLENILTAETIAAAEAASIDLTSGGGY
ncbi:hypothetical protein NE619_17070 [Anaerovorax odorimutans]|uniref:Uncharacterized protein n=1 Tax=Anaerovorax odorimutans TaxID=109327 RepID=A0ABT1RTA7_9FIRM|nr:hypothetical protein [Anaerovorax odorimutans]MCQ4638444.1 hypothetical protein [Anaerovorax odorimutans]